MTDGARRLHYFFFLSYFKPLISFLAGESGLPRDQGIHFPVLMYLTFWYSKLDQHYSSTASTLFAVCSATRAFSFSAAEPYSVGNKMPYLSGCELMTVRAKPRRGGLRLHMGYTVSEPTSTLLYFSAIKRLCCGGDKTPPLNHMPRLRTYFRNTYDTRSVTPAGNLHKLSILLARICLA